MNSLGDIERFIKYAGKRYEEDLKPFRAEEDRLEAAIKAAETRQETRVFRTQLSELVMPPKKWIHVKGVNPGPQLLRLKKIIPGNVMHYVVASESMVELAVEQELGYELYEDAVNGNSKILTAAQLNDLINLDADNVESLQMQNPAFIIVFDADTRDELMMIGLASLYSYTGTSQVVLFGASAYLPEFVMDRVVSFKAGSAKALLKTSHYAEMGRGMRGLESAMNTKAVNQIVTIMSRSKDETDNFMLIMPSEAAAYEAFNRLRAEPSMTKARMVVAKKASDARAITNKTYKAQASGAQRVSDRTLIICFGDVGSWALTNVAVIMDSGLMTVRSTDEHGFTTEYPCPVDQRELIRRSMVGKAYHLVEYQARMSAEDKKAGVRPDEQKLVVDEEHILSPNAGRVRYMLSKDRSFMYDGVNPDLMRLYRESTPVRAIAGFDLRPLRVEFVTRGRRDANFLVAALQLRPKGFLIKALKRVSKDGARLFVNKKIAFLGVELAKIQNVARPDKPLNMEELIDVLTPIYGPPVDGVLQLGPPGEDFYMTMDGQPRA